jgi:hypothetical protein
MINELYFSKNFTNIENKKIRNMNSNIKDAKEFIFNLRHTYNHDLFLREPLIYSKAYDITLKNSYFLSFQRFLFVFNRSFQELVVFLKEIIRYRAFFPPYIKGYEDIYWVKRFGDRDGSYQPVVTEESLKKSSIMSLYKGFSFGIPTLDYSDSKLVCSNKANIDLLMINEIRNLIEKNNSKLILVRMPRLYERYPKENEIKQINYLLPEFIFHSEEIHNQLMKKENYADVRHFNLYGREVYKNWLIDALKTKLND